MKNFSNYVRNRGYQGIGKYAARAGILVMLLFMMAPKGYAATTLTLSTPASVSAASMCPGANQQIIYEFTLVASGIFPNTSLTGITFSQSGTATSSDIVQYELWSGSAGGTLIASSNNTSFTGFSTLYIALFGTTINYWITADISPNATAGHTIIVDPMTTASFTTTSGLKATFGTIVSGGAQTVLLAPTSITGSAMVCVGTTETLTNGISGGTWTSSNTDVATVTPATGVVTGVSAGTAYITYQISTGCLVNVNEVVNPLPDLYNVTGGGSYCSGGTGVHVGLSGSAPGIYYQLFNGATTAGDGTGSGEGTIDFGLQTGAGTYTVLATNIATSCTRNMSGSATVAINPLPPVHTVTGGGTLCAGGTGYHIGLAGSETGINYRLYRGSTPVTSLMPGTTGAALDFGVFTTAGTYSVVATNATTSCINNMTGTAGVVVNPLPTLYNVIGGGNYCAGGSGVHVYLSWSQAGIIYILYNGTATVGSPVAGTGFMLDFGLQTASGNYTVVAMNATTYCTRNMTGSANVVINPAPTSYAVTGGGSYCNGGAGLHVGLGSSDAGISYMLYNGATLSGSPVAGSGAPIDFGIQTTAGTYSVIGVNSATTCMNNMAGTTNIIINPLPVVQTVTGGGNYCSGGSGIHVGLSASNTGINYQLYSGTTTVGSPVPGTGASMDFGLQTLGGIYTVMATDNTTLCTKSMAGSASILINPLPPVHNVTGGGHYCTGGPFGPYITESAAAGTEVHVGLDGSDEGMIYLLYNGAATVGSPVAGTGEALDFGVEYAAGNYTVLAIDAATLCTKNMSGTAVITINPIVIPSVTIDPASTHQICEGKVTVFTALTTDCGTYPAYLWKINGTTVGTGNSYTYIPVNGDVVYAMVTSDVICAEPASVSTTVTVNVIQPVIPAVTISAEPSTHVMSGEPITFTAHVTGGGVNPSYQWVVNEAPVAGATLATYTTAVLSNHDSVSCIVTRDDACAMKSSDNAIVTIQGLGVQEVSQSGNMLTVMPNPNNGTFTIKGSLASAANTAITIELTNMVGQVVYKMDAMAVNGIVNETITPGNKATGLYILNVRTANENMALRVMIE